MLNNYEKITLVAQKISNAFEDSYLDVEKRKQFEAFFNRFLSDIDTAGNMDLYDAIVTLGLKNPSEFERMVKEIKANSLIVDE